MSDQETSLKNFSQEHFYQDNDKEMKKQQLTNKKHRTEEMAIA